MTVVVRPATNQDVEPLSHVLARAFHDDPFHRWIFPDERAWARSSHRSFALALRGEVEHGTVFTDDSLRGAAIWRRPERGPLSIGEQLRVAVPMISLLRTRAPPVLRGFRRLLALHPVEPHWYLGVLGTDPEHQGRGIGSALMHAVLDRCDGGGHEGAHSAYLEASRPENVPYYERHGFEVIGESRMPDGPPVWRMLHTPRS